jgi:hypothetical protein
MLVQVHKLTRLRSGNIKVVSDRRSEQMVVNLSALYLSRHGLKRKRIS